MKCLRYHSKQQTVHNTGEEEEVIRIDKIRNEYVKATTQVKWFEDKALWKCEIN